MADGTPSSEAYAIFCRFLKVYLTDRDIDALMPLFTDNTCGIGTGAQEIACGKDEIHDDFQTCESVTKMLDSVGIRSDWTTVAREAVNRVQMACSANDPFYGYIIDRIMPEMNGIEFTRRIRKVAGDDIPIIILTACDWEDIADEARQAGVTGFCTKPLFLSDLTKALLDHSEEAPERPSEHIQLSSENL